MPVRGNGPSPAPISMLEIGLIRSVGLRPGTMVRRLVAIMFTDVVGFTASAQTDEAGALRRLQEQAAIVRPIFGPYGGTEIKSTGDGFLVEFESALQATECAVEIQRRLRDRNAREQGPSIEVRIGIHVGDVEAGGGDIYGDAVNVASRVVPLAEPGGVCISEHVFSHVRSKVSYPLEKLPSSSLKGVQERLEVYRLILPWDRPQHSSRASGIPRLAVLPLANISPDPKDEYFADGLTEELITVLSQVKGLRVVSHTSVNQYKGTTKPVAQIGSELGVESVLEGSVRKAGEQLRIAVQLIDTRTDEHRWAKTYDRKFENVFAIQAEVAEQTASALKVELMRSEREAIRERPTSSLAAYEAYLRGIEGFRKSMLADEKSREALSRETVSRFEEAIREDPQFGAAYAYLANHLLGVMGSMRPAKEVLPRARELVTRALELSPNSSDAHTARGNLAFQADLDWVRAEAEFQEAIALNPSDPVPHMWYGYLLWALQRFDEATKQSLEAVELDPLWLLPRIHLVMIQEARGDYAAVVTSVESVIARFGESQYLRGRLARGYALAGRVDEALRLLPQAGEDEDTSSQVTRAIVLSYRNELEELRKVMADWESGGWPVYAALPDVASGYARLGEVEKALALIERDYREGDRVLWNSYQGNWFDGMRNEPRFLAILRAMNLPTTLKRLERKTETRPTG